MTNGFDCGTSAADSLAKHSQEQAFHDTQARAAVL
jgi:hypothetical protein